MKKVEWAGTIVLIGGLLALSVGLLYVSVGANPASAGDAPTTTTPGASEMTTQTPDPTTTAASDARPVGPKVLSSSYSEADNGLLTKLLTGEGENWKLHVYRNGTLLTTIVPEEHEVSGGEVSPTTAYWNENVSLPENKSFALIGSRIDSGANTTTASDDVYGVTLMLPNVDANETITIEYVAEGETTVLIDDDPQQ